MPLLKTYHDLMEWIVRLGPKHPDKFMHTYVGLAIWLGSAIVLRRKLSSPLPLLVLIALEGFNESLDFVGEKNWSLHGTITDLLSTFLWPVSFFVAMRLFPWLEKGRD